MTKWEEVLGREEQFRAAWRMLKERLARLCEADTNPMRAMYRNVDHGPHHWKKVAETCKVLWSAVCSEHRNWWSAEAAFLLLASAHLHDVSMVWGYDQIELDQLPAHVIRKLKESGYGGWKKLTVEAAASPLGQLLIRQHQSVIAGGVVRQWATGAGPLVGISQLTVERLAFLVRHYAHIDTGARELAKRLEGPLAPHRLLAMAAVLQFADWSHLDQSRAKPEAIKDGMEQASQQLKELEENPSLALDADCGVLCLLPKLFRSHYVYDRRVRSEGTKGVRFAVRLACPIGLHKEGYDHAYQRLLMEWRAHLYPSRMVRPTAADHLREFAGIELFYTEPSVDDNFDQTKFLPVPALVRDYWAASRWFNLEDTAQLLFPSGRHPAINDVLSAHPSDELYGALRARESDQLQDRPALSRRAFLYFHLKLTRGHPVLAGLFFRQLHHDISCSHRAVRGESMMKHALEIELELRDSLIAGWGLVLGRENLTTEEERYAALVSKYAPFGAFIGLKDLAKLGRQRGMRRDALSSFIAKAKDSDAIVTRSNVVEIAGQTKSSAALCLYCRPFGSDAVPGHMGV